ncbi:kynurenine/alpha-aminoadipate aminotransferase, mitochondrial-like [Mya arenaria]|uniref:kynurenine/alpha-aminoadipate aminotransferase, mitochondrial-like n=1 Tax=Mya arenaria TaxID=6604 RepID=UPI0022E4EFB1|nr:kynurenine/alpha-aminoadipate aminotransferase, mitochondrial-like [Mya arenaria]
MTMDYSSFFNKLTMKRRPSPLWELHDSLNIDASYVLMASGMPNPDVFPLKSMELTLPEGTKVEIGQRDLHIGLQYQSTRGLAELITFITSLVKRLHDPPTWNIPGCSGAHCITTSCGAQDGLYKTLELLLEDGDIILSEEFTYPSMIGTSRPFGADVQTVRTDKHGIVPESLEALLSQWPKPEPGKLTAGKVKALYCVPNGDNPTGIRYTVERKRAIYKLACQYNFLIIEDDAYFFLEERPLTQSFLSLDTEGRVIRLDTFSKTMAPGFRLGFATIPRPLYQKFNLSAQVSTQGSSSLSQSILMALLRRWGVDGYLDHCERVCEFYANRRQTCERLARKYLQDEAEWESPSGGMFLWLKFKRLTDSSPLIMERLLNRKLLIVAGSEFSKENGVQSPYARIAFSLASDEQMEKGFAIIAEELKKIHDEKTD